MKSISILLLLIFFTCNIYAQKAGIEKLTTHYIDSLNQIGVDTVMAYRSYCGECFTKGTNDPIQYARCTVQNGGYDLTYNAIIYKQKGLYFIINFDCYNVSSKLKLDSCKSMPYFISIIPTLNARDKTIKEMKKRGEFLGPFQIDGGFEDAEIYLNHKVQHIHVEDQMEDTQSALYKAYKKHFWIDKQIKLMGLIWTDVAEKKN